MTGSPALNRRSKLGWNVLFACLAIESFLLIWVVLVTLLAAIRTQAGSAQNFSLVAVAVICLAWVIITLFGSVRSHTSWARGSAVTLHVLLFAAGTGCLQLQIGPWWLGFGLILLAFVGFFAALLARPALPAGPGAQTEQPGLHL